MKYTAIIQIDTDDDLGWSGGSLTSLLEDAMADYGISATIAVNEVIERPPRICTNCAAVDEYDDHWTSLDGPNRQGYTCTRSQ